MGIRIIGRRTYKGPINYDRSVAEAVIAGKYDILKLYKGSLTDEEFPPKKLGIVRRNIELIQFDFGFDWQKTAGITGSKNIIKAITHAMKEIALIPATFHEILSLGENSPRVQRTFRIVALGSIVSDFNSDYCQFLHGSESQRICGMHDVLSGLRPVWCFAATPAS